MAHSQVFTSTSSRNKHSLQPRPKPSKRSRNEPTPQTRRQAKQQRRAKKAVIVNLTVRIKRGLLCPFPAACISEHQNSSRSSNMCCALLAHSVHHVSAKTSGAKYAPSSPMQQLRVKSGPNFLHTAHQPCTLTRDAPSFPQLMRQSAVHLKGVTCLLDLPRTHGRHLARDQRPTFPHFCWRSPQDYSRLVWCFLDGPPFGPK